MWGRVLSELLSLTLGTYIREINAEELNVALWGGAIELSHLHLKDSALHSLDIPFDICGGVMDKLKISIPWRALFSQPSEVEISDLHILLKPRPTEMKYNAKKAEKEAQTAKQKKLQALERSKKEKRQTKEEDLGAHSPTNNDGYTTKIINGILENLQVFVNRVHIRIEDEQHNFSSGITIQSIDLSTPIKLDDMESPFVDKLATLRQVGIYWNPSLETKIPYEDDSKFISMMKWYTEKNDRTPNNYILKPITCSASIRIKKKSFEDPEFQFPLQIIRILLDTIEVEVKQRQLQQIIYWKDRTHIYRIRKQYKKFRPSSKYTASSDPMRFWKFLIQSQLSLLRHTTRSRTPTHLTTRRKNRLEYMSLWKASVMQAQSADPNRLAHMETFLSFEDIAYFRSLAEAKIPSGFFPEQKSKSWLAWGSSLFTTTPVLEIDNTHNDSFSGKEKEEILRSIGYSGDESSDYPPHFDILTLHFHVRNIHFRLLGNHKERDNLSSVVVAEGSLFDLEIALSQKVKSSVVRFDVRSFELVDRFTEDTMYPVIAKPLVDEYEYYLSAVVEVNPISSQNDFHIELVLQPSDFVVQPEFISEILSLLASSFSSQESQEKKLEVAADDHFRAIKHISRLQASYILDNHKRIYVRVKAHVPRIIFIERASDPQATLLLLRPGFFSIESETPPLGDYDTHSKNDLLYDRFRIQWEDISASLFSDSSNLIPFSLSLSPSPSCFTLLQPLSISLSVGLLMCPPSEEMTKIRLSGYSTQMNVAINAPTLSRIITLLKSILKPFQSNLKTASAKKEVEEPLALLMAKEALPDSPIPSTTPYINEKHMDIHFKFGEVRCCLLSPQQILLSQVTLEETILQLFMKEHDIQLYISTQEFSISNLMKSGEPSSSLLSSKDPEHLISYSLPSPFLEIALQTFRDERSPQYKEVETSLHVSVQRLFSTLHPPTLLSFYTFIQDVQEGNKEREQEGEGEVWADSDSDDFFDMEECSNPPLLSDVSESYTKIEEGKRRRQKKESWIQFRLIFALDRIVFRLQDVEQHQISKVTFSSITTLAEMGESSFSTFFSLGRFAIHNPAKTSPLILSLGKNDFISLQFIHHSSKYMAKEGNSLENEFFLSVRSLRALFLPDFLFLNIQFLDYVHDLYKEVRCQRSQGCPESTLLTSHPDNSPPPIQMAILFDMNVDPWHIIIPRNSQDKEMIHMAVGPVELSNQILSSSEHIFDSITLSLSSFSIHTGQLPMKDELSLVKDVSASFCLRRRLTPALSTLIPTFDLYGTLSPIICTLSDAVVSSTVSTTVQLVSELSLRFSHRYCTRLGDSTKLPMKGSQDSPLAANSNDIQVKIEFNSIRLQLLLQKESKPLFEVQIKDCYISGQSSGEERGIDAYTKHVAFLNAFQIDYPPNFGYASISVSKKGLIHVTAHGIRLVLIPELLKSLSSFAAIPFDISLPHYVKETIPLSIEPVPPLAPVQNETLDKEALSQGLHISIDCTQCMIATIADAWDRNCYFPFLMCTIQVALYISSPCVTCETKMHMNYYNKFISNWEPLIEPWDHLISFHRANSSGAAHGHQVSFSSSTYLPLNITKVFIEEVIHISSLWQKSTEQGKENQKDNLNIGMVVLYNDTDVDVCFRVEGTSGMKDLLASGSKRELSAIIGLDPESIHTHSISIELLLLDEHYAIENLPIHRTGSWILPVGKGEKKEGPHVEWHVELLKTKRMITIRSCYTVLNNCSIPIVLRASKGLPPLPNAIVPPGALYSVPLSFPEYYSEKSGIIQATPRPNRVEEGEEGEEGEYVVASSFVRQGNRQRLTFSPPFILENVLSVQVVVELSVIKSKKKERVVLERGQSHEFFLTTKLNTMRLSIELGGYEKTNPFPIKILESTQDIPVLYLPQRTSLLLHLRNSLTPFGTCFSSFFCPYWFVNKTGLQVRCKEHRSNSIAPGQSGHENEKDDALQPLMFSYNQASSMVFANKTVIQVGNSQWSDPLRFDSVGTKGCFIVKEIESSQQFDIGVAIDLMKGRFLHTKVVTFSPRYILVNQTSNTLYFRQIQSKVGHLVVAGERSPFHWADYTKELELCLTINDRYLWSPSFSPAEINTFTLKMKRKEGNGSGTEEVIDVEIQLLDASFLVVCKTGTRKNPPYRIDNCTGRSIIYYQKNLKDSVSYSLPPYSQAPYYFDIPDAPDHVVVIEMEEYGYRREFNVDIIGRKEPDTCLLQTRYKGSYDSRDSMKLVGEVTVEGVTRILQLIDPLVHPLRPDTPAISLTSSEDQRNSFSLQVQCYGIGISCIDHTPKEVLYINVRKVSFLLRHSKKQLTLQSSIGDIQIDNQTFNATHPVLLSRSLLVGRRREGEEADSIFQLSIVMSNYFPSVIFFHYFSFLLQQIDINLDDAIINDLLAFARFHGVGGRQKIPEHKKSFLHDDPMSRGGIRVPKKTNKKIYFSLLTIHPFQFNLTFTISSHSSNDSGTKDFSAPVGNDVLRSLSSAIGISVANVEKAPISLNVLQLENAFLTQSEIIHRISKHYTQQALMRVYNIIGSFDIIGNPVSFVHNMGTGLKDFFYEPAKGAVQSPTDFILGVKKGSSSLALNSLIGASSSLSNVMKTLGKGASRLSFDPSFEESRNELSRETPTALWQGLYWGTKELKNGVLGGVTGLVTQPALGYQNNGLWGFWGGAVKGTVGSIVKPTVGVFDFVTRTSQGIKNKAMLNEECRRVRPPRGFGPERILMNYSLEKSIGHSILFSLSTNHRNHRKKDEFHLFHCFTHTFEELFLVSNTTLYLISIKQQTVLFSTNLDVIDKASVQIARDRITLEFVMVTNQKKVAKLIEFPSQEIALSVEKRLKRLLTILVLRESSCLAFSTNMFSFE